MKREFLTTGDGSVTIHLPDWNEQYHSKHGALNEALHVFIAMGFDFLKSQQSLSEVNIMEIGFGTGLNAYLTLLRSREVKTSVNYVGVEGYPVALEEVEKLNYPESVGNDPEAFKKLHETAWEEASLVAKGFSLHKRKQFFSEIEDKEVYHLIYFDAFGARVQPELWTEAIFQKMYNALLPNGVLVTYAAKGSVRRAMQAVGFTVERLPGPPGKREMLRARKGE
ncbi:tRNA (5-methylaminomethyl-2-thiouridine)(34)-methyltransferase MnmD [Aureisphaera galaxeae]|uniref:tRNA (5-methylaminomethyl-2-thiouridine)(34)-methyltransferase MnmD n=1 Tax=Aureisphaera galaxeae TaxID=1538023 RepID=UPI002350555B|nr:tRNA (5-methylaminomethyl-2-thiouridine)(34)-methyltransferase MnmD [Aureisphaera galaxeae]MDC8006233.1 tRNA (5-methylaminomethyl-2-thiouridine)(34)-methyltransferase MnmD [Aureisphaera galaxeae]